MADQTLDDARFLFQNGRFNATADRAYYAMFHAAQAALAAGQVALPKTHLGTMTLFVEKYVRTGRTGRPFSKDLQDAHELRLRSNYGEGGITNRQAERAVAKAEKFVAEVKRLVGA